MSVIDAGRVAADKSVYLSVYVSEGFSYKLGATKTFRGKSVWEVVLTARDKKQELERITLFVTKDTYEPLYILLQQRGQQTRNEITVTSYQTGQNYTDRVFTFDKKTISQCRGDRFEITCFYNKTIKIN